ncbi:xylulokinase [Arsenicicoccus bolidensis]|uniref:Xylulose kinase n=1 Tax=Arsenicicoccus bolidensis TaxID=229480 RepID=A0ABS9PZ08_9MICO|nr:FGGY family carbohydrate kinase [Arsenicicoccus bolidensis]MCG7320860.1 xylulose kinase [Arsenicicoccus bolidensis]
MALVAGVDSSTQSCKVVIRDAQTGELVRHGRAPHPPGTEVNPAAWWDALRRAIAEAGGLDDVAAISVAGQQHGMVCLDSRGEVVRPALLWNDTRSAQAAVDLTTELAHLGGGDGTEAWVRGSGSGLVASLTVTKLRWLSDIEPEAAAQVAAVALPHDWLTWKLSGSTDIADLVTDRSDASGTGYWSPLTGEYRRDLLGLAFPQAETVRLPRVLQPFESAGSTPSGVVLGPGCGDNAGAALGLGLDAGQAMISLGTSGVVAAVSETPAVDLSGDIAGFADATGAFLPLACTLNASRILDAARSLLGVNYDRLSELALSAQPGAGGLVHIPYLEGERTPNLPTATGSLHGMTLANVTPSNLARAAVEGLLCHMRGALDAVEALGPPVAEGYLVGGGAQAPAVQALASQLLGIPVVVPDPGEYVADGAARQAATVLLGLTSPVAWRLIEGSRHDDAPADEVVAAFRAQASGVAASFA